MRYIWKICIKLCAVLCLHGSIALAAPLQNITVSLGYHIDPCQGPVLYAILKGIFRKHGLNVSITSASGGEESARQVATHSAHIGITKSANHMVRVHSGMPLVYIGNLVDVPLEGLMVRSDSAVRTSAPSASTHHKDLAKNHISKVMTKGPISRLDLKGKNIGFHTSNPAFTILALRKILERAHITEKDVTLIAYPSGLLRALLTGQVDAIITATDPHDTILAEQQGAPCDFYSYTEFGIPHYAQFVFFIHKKNKHASFIVPFLQAIKEAVMCIKKNPGACWQSLCDAYPDLDTTTNYRIWLRMTELFTSAPHDINQDKARMLLNFLKAHRIDGRPVVKKYLHLFDVLAPVPSHPNHAQKYLRAQILKAFADKKSDTFFVHWEYDLLPKHLFHAIEAAARNYTLHGI